MTSDNIIPVSDLAALRKRLSEKVIVLATGCFDILHVGHLHFLRDASKQGDFLIVGVNSDRSIKLIKGPERPIICQDERAELVAAFRCVDYVFVYDDIVADDCILRLRPNVFAIGEESVKIYPSEPAIANQIGAKVHVVIRIQSASTSSILATFRNNEIPKR